MSSEASLNQAILNNDPDKVQSILQSFIDENYDAWNVHPLHLAISQGNASIVRLLLAETRIIAIHKDRYGVPALYQAVTFGKREVVRVVIAYGADVNDVEPVDGNTCLHMAALRGFSSCIELLCRCRANPNLQNNAGFLPIHLAAQYGHTQSVRLLLYAGSSIYVKNKFGDTVLHTAVRYGNLSIVRILLTTPTLILEVNRNGDNPLHVAVGLRRKEIARILIHANYESRLAAVKRHESVPRDIRTICNNQGETPLQLARRKGFLELESLLEEHLMLVPSENEQNLTSAQCSSQASCLSTPCRCERTICSLSHRQNGESIPNVTHEKESNQQPTLETSSPDVCVLDEDYPGLAHTFPEHGEQIVLSEDSGLPDTPFTEYPINGRLPPTEFPSSATWSTRLGRPWQALQHKHSDFFIRPNDLQHSTVASRDTWPKENENLIHPSGKNYYCCNRTAPLTALENKQTEMLSVIREAPDDSFGQFSGITRSLTDLTLEQRDRQTHSAQLHFNDAPRQSEELNFVPYTGAVSVRCDPKYPFTIPHVRSKNKNDIQKAFSGDFLLDKENKFTKKSIFTRIFRSIKVKTRKAPVESTVPNNQIKISGCAPEHCRKQEPVMYSGSRALYPNFAKVHNFPKQTWVPRKVTRDVDSVNYDPVIGTNNPVFLNRCRSEESLVSPDNRKNVIDMKDFSGTFKLKNSLSRSIFRRSLHETMPR